MEVRERRVGAGRQGWGSASEPDLHPPGEPELRRALDEGGRLLRQGQADEQVERQRADNAELAAQVRAEGAPRARRRGGAENGTWIFLWKNYIWPF